jgi:hypothetical protein
VEAASGVEYFQIGRMPRFARALRSMATSGRRFSPLTLLYFTRRGNKSTSNSGGGAVSRKRWTLIIMDDDKCEDAVLVRGAALPARDNSF